MSLGVVLGLCVALWVYMIYAVEMNQAAWLLLNIVDSVSSITLFTSITPRDPIILRGPIQVWVVWLTINLFDKIVTPFISWIPFYRLHRSLFSAFILFCRITASGFLYETIIRPNLLPWQEELDLFLDFTRHGFDMIIHHLIIIPGRWILPRIFTKRAEEVVQQLVYTPRHVRFIPSTITTPINRRARRAAQFGRHNYNYCNERPTIDPYNPFYVGQGAMPRMEVVDTFDDGYGSYARHPNTFTKEELMAEDVYPKRNVWAPKKPATERWQSEVWHAAVQPLGAMEGTGGGYPAGRGIAHQLSSDAPVVAPEPVTPQARSIKVGGQKYPADILWAPRKPHARTLFNQLD